MIISSLQAFIFQEVESISIKILCEIFSMFQCSQIQHADYKRLYPTREALSFFFVTNINIDV